MRPQDRAKFDGCFGLELRAWKREMWNAIQDAANGTSGMYVNNNINPIYGLKTIREFEAVNGIDFDPFNGLHRMKVSGMGRFLSVLCAWKRITSNF